MATATLERPMTKRKPTTISEPEQTVEERRQAAATELARIEAESQEAGRIAKQAYDVADRAYSDALAAYREAEEARRLARSRWTNSGLRFANAKAQHERTLKNLASPDIEELRDRIMRDMANADKASGSYAHRCAVQDRRNAAIKELDGLWRLADQDELQETLARIARDCGIE